MPRKRLEFSLSPFQAVVLGTAGTLTLVISFVIGILVGKEMQGSPMLERDVKSNVYKMKIEPMPFPQAEAPVLSGSTTGSTVMKNITSKPVITFYDTLVKTGKKKNESPTPKVSEDKKESRKKAYTIQVGAMKDKALANAMVAKLKKNGYSAYISESAGGWYKVRIGTFYGKESARKEAAKIRKNEGLATTVVEK